MTTLPVTVLIPAYNRPEMTRRAVRSALAQRPHPPAEVLVVDDCSTDDTGDAARAEGARVIRHEVNQGEGGARNTGVAEATQPWIGLLDSDDEWLPNLLASVWPLREDPKVALVAGSALYVGPEPGRTRYQGLLRSRPRVVRSPRALLYPGNFIPASGVLVRRDVVQQVGGFDTSLRFGADMDLWLRVLEHGWAAMSPEPVMLYHLHEGQVTHDKDAMAEGHLRVVERYADRAWYSHSRVEGWRGGAAWDRMRRTEPAPVLPTLWFLSGHPARIPGLAGILGRRAILRRRKEEVPA